MTRAPMAAGARALAFVAAALLAGPLLGSETHPFYRQLLEDGLRSYDRGEHGRAREELRIAAFGLLETPEELARALAYLALAHRAGGDLERFETTHRRLTELESRFGAYSDATLPAEIRGALELAAGKGPEVAGRDVPSAAAEPAAPALGVATIPSPRLCISWTGDGTCQQAGGASPAAAPAAPAPPAEPPSPTPEELESFHRLDRLSTDRASGRQLRAGLEQAGALADRYPDWSEMQRVAGVLASRSGSYADAVRYYDRSGEQIDAPLELFYLSIALFETDQPDEAATVLRRALPTLERNGVVRRYMKLILDEESAG